VFFFNAFFTPTETTRISAGYCAAPLFAQQTITFPQTHFLPFQTNRTEPTGRIHSGFIKRF
jgi:hypothetical protein